LFEPRSDEQNCQKGVEGNGRQQKFSDESCAKAQVSEASSRQQILDEHRSEARGDCFTARPASNP
jgi:hypothetical protein